MSKTNFEPGRRVTTAFLFGVTQGFNAFITGMLAAGAVVLGYQNNETPAQPSRRPR